MTVAPLGKQAMNELFAAANAEEASIREALRAEGLATLLTLLDRAIEALEEVP